MLKVREALQHQLTRSYDASAAEPASAEAVPGDIDPQAPAADGPGSPEIAEREPDEDAVDGEPLRNPETAGEIHHMRSADGWGQGLPEVDEVDDEADKFTTPDRRCRRGFRSPSGHDGEKAACDGETPPTIPATDTEIEKMWGFRPKPVATPTRNTADAPIEADAYIVYSPLSSYAVTPDT